MEPELPSQRTCLAHLMPQIYRILKQGKITFGLDPKQHCPKELFANIINTIEITMYSVRLGSRLIGGNHLVSYINV